ncbi:hypothetical protein KEM55_003166, partial [Ascosphaera atra]
MDRKITLVSPPKNAVTRMAQTARSLPGLLKAVPEAYAPVLHPFIKRIHNLAGKEFLLRQTVNELQHHQSVGSFPSFVLNAVSEPALQFVKPFLDGLPSQSGLPSLEADINAFRNTLLAHSLQLNCQFRRITVSRSGRDSGGGKLLFSDVRTAYEAVSKKETLGEPDSSLTAQQDLVQDVWGFYYRSATEQPLFTEDWYE